VVGGVRYRKKDGRGFSSRTWLRECTQGIKDEAEKRNAVWELGRITWSRMPLDKLRRIMAVVNEEEPEPPQS
jgi:hypothetical protein